MAKGSNRKNAQSLGYQLQAYLNDLDGRSIVEKLSLSNLWTQFTAHLANRNPHGKNFWQGEWAVPIAALVDRPYTDVDLEEGRARLQMAIDEGDYPYSVDDDVREFLTRATGRAVWARGKIVWDDPVAIEEGEEVGHLVAALRRKNDTLQESLTIESAYFVVGDRGVANVEKFVKRGVNVRILTNSLASNDVLAAHAGHANYRKQLLEAGAEVYELRADSAIIKETWKGKSQAGLHT